MPPPLVCMLVRGPCTHDARVLKEAKTLAASGYGVVIIAALEPGIPREEERDGFRIVRIPVRPLYSRFLRWLQGGLLALRRWLFRRSAPATTRTAAAAGGRRAPPSRALALLYALQSPLMLADYAWRVFWATRRIPAAVYHAHDLSTLPAAWALSRLRHAKLIYDSHELNLEAGRWAGVGGLPKRVLRWQEGFLARRAGAAITVNESIATVFEERYSVRPAVVMNCPEPLRPPSDEPLLHRRLGLPVDTPLVLYQGGLTEGRGLEELVTAFDRVEGAVGVLMGSGALRDGLEALAEERGLGDRVRFLDPVSQEELLAQTASARVGVVCYRATSMNNYLASPNKLFEYLMAGVPVAGSDFPEIARVVRQNDVGELFDPEDPASIAAAINRLLARPDYDALRARAGSLARSRYSWEFEGEKLLAVYRTVLPPGAGGAPEKTRVSSTT